MRAAAIFFCRQTDIPRTHEFLFFYKHIDKCNLAVV